MWLTLLPGEAFLFCKPHWFMGPCGNSGWEGAPPPSTDHAISDGSEAKLNRAEEVRPILYLTREDCDWYASHYCEENTVRLCTHLLGRAYSADVELFIVFVSNQARQVPVWNQRLADSRDDPVLWDYHVLLLAKHPQGNWVYDLDSTLAFPTQAAQYMTQAFRRGHRMEERFRQKFRVVSGRECVDHFSSDRSHMMQRGGAYSAEPPRLDPLRGPRSSTDNNIDEWISMDAATGRGRVMSLDEMEAFVEHAPHRYT